MVVKRSKEELFGHDPALRRALDGLTQGKEGIDPLYSAPPASEPAPTFDADRYQEKTLPPGFLEFARNVKSPSLKLAQEPPKTEKARPSASLAGLPVYSAPMVPPVAAEPSVEPERVLLAGDVRPEPDSRRADTLLTIRVLAPVDAASSLANRVSTRRLMRRTLGVVVVVALAILGATVALSPPTSRSRSGVPSVKAPVDVPAPSSSVEPSSARSAPAAVPDSPSQRTAPTAASVSRPPPPATSTHEAVGAVNAGKHTPIPARAERRPQVEAVRPTPTVDPKPAPPEPAISPDDMPLFDNKTMPSRTNTSFPRSAD